MKKLLGILVLGLLYFNSAHSDEWKIKNKWKVSCGIVDKESLVVNGKPKTKYNKNEFKLESVVFKLDKGEVGKCKNDKKDGTHGGFHYAGRQEITHRLPIGHTIFETDILIEGTPQYRSTVFQIHDGRNKGAPPSWIGIGMDWKIKYKFPKGECPPNKCKKIKTVYLKPGVKNRFKADINYQRKAKNLSVYYYLNDELIAQHIDVPLYKKKTDGPYGPSKPYIKIGIYRIGETGTTSFAYNNLVIKNKKIRVGKEKQDVVGNLPPNDIKQFEPAADKYRAIVKNKTDNTILIKAEGPTKEAAEKEAMKICIGKSIQSSFKEACYIHYVAAKPDYDM